MDNDRIVQHLVDGLTGRQLAGLVARFWERLADGERDRFCAALPTEVAAVLQGLASAPTPGAAASTAGWSVSDAKFVAQFHAAVGALQDRLNELGDEDGEYVLQEHAWEPPEFDAYRLADDIERCAQGLLPLLERAAALEIEDESFFLDVCREIADSIGHYPERIYHDDGVDLGRTASECVLRWLDLHAAGAAAFLDQLVAFLAEAGCVRLDRATVRAYLLTGWPEDRRRALYRALEERRAADAAFRQLTDTPRTLWHDLRCALAATFDADADAQMAEASVGDDWTQGTALVEAAVAAGHSARALEFCRKTMDTYCRQRSADRAVAAFEPATMPLFGPWGAAADAPLLGRLLGIWAELSAKAGDRRLAGLLTVQQALVTDADDWSAVRAAFAPLDRADADVLLHAWKARVVRTASDSSAGGLPRQAPAWLEWLIDAGFADDYGAFVDKALPWLSEAGGTERSVPREAFQYAAEHVWPPQMSLLADLADFGPALGSAPTLRAMLAQHCRLAACPARLEWLGRTDVVGLTSAGLGFVRRNLARLVPSPETMGNDYTPAAGWLAVARELAPAVAQDILQSWQVEYGRRRNLWRDLREYGFAV